MDEVASCGGETLQRAPKMEAGAFLFFQNTLYFGLLAHPMYIEDSLNELNPSFRGGNKVSDI